MRKLERIFLLGFFDVMKQLIDHFLDEARVCGLVQYKLKCLFESKTQKLIFNVSFSNKIFFTKKSKCSFQVFAPSTEDDH